MSEYPLTVRPLSREEGGGYLVEFPDLPGCMSDGETVEEAIRNGEEAKRDWIAAMKEAGRTIPAPSAKSAASHSGKWQLRTPTSLHRRLADRAREEGVSLNMLAVTLLAEGLGEREAHSRILWHLAENAPRLAGNSPERSKTSSARIGTNARFVEEVLKSNSPRALRPAEIRLAIQRDKGVELALTSIRHALGQLKQRHTAEVVGDGNSWRHHDAKSGEN